MFQQFVKMDKKLNPFACPDLIIQILDVLYATTDGFEVPDEANGVDDEQDEY